MVRETVYSLQKIAFFNVIVGTPRSVKLNGVVMLRLMLWFFGFLFVIFSRAANAEIVTIPSLPRDFSNVEVYLGTRDIGHQIYTKYGHTILRIVNYENHTDVGYNWGAFDFNEPGFIPKFLKGILIYQMTYGYFRDDVEVSIAEQQTMWMERINLTTKQKETLIRRINWQAQPENVKYPYLFFYDNCSTRVRDYLDEALGGAIKVRSMNHMIGKSYRDRVMEHNSSEPLLAMGQDVILNSEPDKQMSAWDDMFIPIYLREYLLEIPAIDDLGREIEGRKLLSDTRILAKFPPPVAADFNGFELVCIAVSLPAMLGIILLKFGGLTSFGIRMIGFSTVMLGGLWSFFGLFMSLSWVFGSHTVLPHNANLFLMWPTDVSYLFLGFGLLKSGRWSDPQTRFAKLMAVNTVCHLVAMFVLAGIAKFGFIPQNVTRIAAYFVPLTVFIYVISSFPIKILRAAKDSAQSDSGH